MAIFRPFCAVRHSREKAAEVAALPYDVMSSKEARVICNDAPLSFLHVDRAEVDLPEGVDVYSAEVYKKAADNLKALVDSGVLIRDHDRCFYLYQEIMDGRSQTGVVGCASVDDYRNGVIKKHELTVQEKEEDRVRHVDACNANTGLIFLAFRKSAQMERRIWDIISSEKPLYDFTADDGVKHVVWKVSDPQDISLFEESFSSMPALYIADGHHRAASAVRVGELRRQQNAGYTGEEEFNFFLAAAFPADELRIYDYNRIVKDLAGLSRDEFLDKIRASFEVERLFDPRGERESDLMCLKPEQPHTISMYLEKTWYRLTVRRTAYNPDNPVDRLDVSILQNRLLGPVLGIKDPRCDSRIGFIGGIRGIRELKDRVDRGDAAVAFAMYPTQMNDLMAIADAGSIMPPKSTWFEPKLRSGLFIHELS